MPLKKYGIFVAYPPQVDLRAEGLGRHLAAFLKAAESMDGVHYSIACPAWSAPTMKALCQSEQVDLTRFELITLARMPLGLSLYFKLKKIRGALGLNELIARAQKAKAKPGLTGKLLVLLLSSFVAFALLLQPQRLVRAKNFVNRQMARIQRVLLRLNIIRPPSGKMRPSLTRRYYKHITEGHLQRLVAKVNRRSDIRAWYAPAAFWPVFNDIAAPGVVCVPDVVLARHPVAFGRQHQHEDSFNNVDLTIRGAKNFITYSNDVKLKTLVQDYHVKPDRIHVIPHAPNSLHELTSIAGFKDMAEAQERYCSTLVTQVIRRFGTAYMQGYNYAGVRYFFYASQFRPNKNVMALLKAYCYLLREKYIGHKLILTGNPHHNEEVRSYIHENWLENDVLCLPGLSVQELAAFYTKADVAVNPTFSEGGCPFTFTEALSVGTPVVMSRIPVALEVLTDPGLEPMFFDPYDWRDMADKMAWAVANKDQLLALQLPVYERLRQRTWGDVVTEHTAVLDRISGETVT